MNDFGQTHRYKTKIIEVNPLNENLEIKFTEGDGFVEVRMVNYKWFNYIDEILNCLEPLATREKANNLDGLVKALIPHLDKIFDYPTWLNPEDPEDSENRFSLKMKASLCAMHEQIKKEMDRE